MNSYLSVLTLLSHTSPTYFVARCMAGYFKKTTVAPATEECEACAIGFYQAEDNSIVGACEACRPADSGAIQTTIAVASTSEADCKGECMLYLYTSIAVFTIILTIPLCVMEHLASTYSISMSIALSTMYILHLDVYCSKELSIYYMTTFVTVTCPAGMQDEDDECKQCPVGSYKEAAGFEDCTNCDAGLTTNGTGHNTSASCNIGMSSY